MRNYIRAQPAREIIKGAFEIYGHNFFTIFLTYILAGVPIRCSE